MYAIRSYYGKSGYKTKREAADAEAAHKRAVKKSVQTQAVTDFRIVASEYLDLAERKFAQKTYKQKAFVCKSFLKHIGNLPIDLITASHLHSYLNSYNFV